MRQRILASLGTAVLVVVSLTSVAGQSGGGAQTTSALRTSWGEPDLQGIWASEYQIPL